MFEPQDFAHHYIQINGIQMHYVQSGHGPQLLVLLHGFPQCWWAWRHLLAQFGTDPALAERFTVIAPDLRGYNETDQPSWGYELDVLVQDVVSLIHGLERQRAIVAGHDWGGIIAWALAIARPHVVERLIILNAPHPKVFTDVLPSSPQQMLRSWYMLFFQLPFLPEIAFRRNNYALLKQLFRDTAIGPNTFSEQDLAIYTQALARPGALSAALNYYRSIAQVGVRGLYRGTQMRVQAPTLLLWGEQDTALGTELVAGTASYVSDLTIRLFPDCSHWIAEEQPDAVFAQIRDFLPDA